MFEKILVPLDTSERAEMIVPYVQALATHIGSEIVLLSVVDPSVALKGVMVGGMPYAVTFDQTQLLNAIERADKYLQDLAETFAPLGITVRDRVELGSIAETILAVAEEEDVSFIAIASHGRSGVGTVIFGSVALRVLHQSDIPLLLLRSPELGEAA